MTRKQKIGMYLSMSMMMACGTQFIAVNNADVRPIVEAPVVLPEQVKHAAINMPLERFMDTRGALELEVLLDTRNATWRPPEESGGGLYYVRETLADDPLVEAITYQFSDDVLYEIVVAYHEEGSAHQAAQDLLDVERNAHESGYWLVRSEGAFDYRIWVFENTYVVADARKFSGR